MYQSGVCTGMSSHHETASLETLWRFIPNRTLFSLHLGFKGNFNKALELGDEKAIKLLKKVDAVKRFILEEDLLQPQALWKEVPCISEGDTIRVTLDNTNTIVIPFPRQNKPNGLCLADYITPEYPTLTFFVTTAGHHHATLCNLIDTQRYTEAFIFHALAVQTAEAYAEWLHFRLRHQVSPQADLSEDIIEKALYNGKRYSFGYSACPDLNQQAAFFKVLDPSAIGVTLHPTMMMEPEASVSAIVFQNRGAQYFSVG